MDKACETSWMVNLQWSIDLLPVRHFDSFDFIALTLLSPQKLYGSHESSVQLWVSYNRQPMKAARFMTRHPITVSPNTNVGSNTTFFFPSSLDIYVYNSWIQCYRVRLRLFWFKAEVQLWPDLVNPSFPVSPTSYFFFLFILPSQVSQWECKGNVRWTNVLRDQLQKWSSWDRCCIFILFINVIISLFIH